jgi:hypothetical protein
MRIFQFARKPPLWLRVALAGLLLAFAINSIADVAHRHDGTTLSAHASKCGYCATFGGLSAAPSYSSSVTTASIVSFVTPVPRFALIAREPVSHAQPRAPPFS